MTIAANTCLSCLSIAECADARKAGPDRLTEHSCSSWSKAPSFVLAARQDTLKLGRPGALALLNTPTHLTGIETPDMANEKYEARQEELSNKHRPALKRELNALLKPLSGKQLRAALQTFKPEEDWPADDDDAKKRANALSLRTPQQEMVESLLAIEFPAETEGEEEVEEKPAAKPKRAARKKAAPKKAAAPKEEAADESGVGAKVAELGVVLNDVATFMEEEREARIKFEENVGLALVVIANGVDLENGYGSLEEIVEFGKELTAEG